MGEQKLAETGEKPLRHGYTTGSCATAATKASLLSLITGEPVTSVEIVIPNGERVTFSIVQQNRGEDWVESGVIKDGGDDPDATHGALILSRVRWRTEPGLRLDGGKGVGRVTKPGLPVPVGEAAINPVPRSMLSNVVAEVLDAYAQTGRGVEVIISVPDGEEIAKKTLNPRLGIIGGISILGTRGTVLPYSLAAWKASIVLALKVAKEAGLDAVAMTTGGRSEKKAQEVFADWPEEAFIQMGEFVGFACRHAKNLGFRRVAIVGMMGKLSKVAQGVMMVHSKSAPVDFPFLAALAADAGADADLQARVREANTAAQVGELMLEAGHTRFFDLLAAGCSKAVFDHIGGGLAIETILTTLQGEMLGRATYDGNASDNHRDRG